MTALLAASPALAEGSGWAIDETDLKQTAYPYEARDMNAQEMLEDFSRLTGLPVEGAVEGEVSIANQAGSASDFLDALSEQTASVWWYDGLTIRIEPRTSMRSTVMGTRGLDLSTLTEAMDFAGLSNDRFATRMSADRTLFNVVGPEGYVIAVEGLIDQIIDARQTRRVGLPVVYRGQVPTNNTGRAEAPAFQTTSAPAQGDNQR